MKKASFIASFIIITVLGILLAFCTSKDNSTKNAHSQNISKSNTFVDQLFIFQEGKDKMASHEFVVCGAMNLTKKGNIIYNVINEKQDTVSYFWGKYNLTDTSLNYLLTDEYYYPGNWDARWDVPNPDYLKGKTRKVISSEVTLKRTKGDSLSFFKQYSQNENNTALKDHDNLKPYSLFYFPYYEPKEMKFYLWFYKQVPALAKL
jgi:hypothetical protein